MYVRSSHKFGKPMKVINAGEYYASGEDEIIGTLLGSCVAVCLYDPVNRVSGMNHFMLPGRISKADIFQDRSAKYGIVAIRELLQEMERKGAQRKNLEAKVFGGGKVLDYEKPTHAIPQDNVRLAKVLLEMEDIPIRELDEGGNFTRKLLMDTLTGKVYLKKSTNAQITEAIRRREKAKASAGKA